MDDRFVTVDLRPYFNADGISTNENMADGVIGLASSFPAEELPEGGTVAEVNGVRAWIPPTADGCLNNIECYKERVEVPSGWYNTLHIFGCCDNGSFEEMFYLSYAGETKKYRIGLSNGLIKKPFFGEKVAFHFTHMHSPKGEQPLETYIWHQSILLDDDLMLNQIQLPDNPCYHIFAMTLERSCD